ncbi:MAG: protein kinase [Isosphaerales bacterium]
MSSSQSNSGAVVELAEEFVERYRKGERPSLKEYIDRYPDLAAEIREVFPAMAMMENIAVADESLELGPEPEPEKPAARSLEQLGDYRIIREIGHGGMGIVYEAEQVSLGRHVALKVLPNQALKDARQKRRFEREARAAAKLHHTNIVPVFGVGEHDGLPYYVMQYIQGLGLDAVLDELNHIKPGGSTPSSADDIRLTRRGATAAQMARSLMTGAFPQGDESINPEPTADAETLGLDAPPVENETGRFDGEGENATLAPSNPATDTPRSGQHSDSFNLSASSLSLRGTSSPVTGRKSTAKRPTYWQSVANIGRQVADALDYAHKQGVLHRDVKPSNLLLDMRGIVWVTDFGLAKVAGPGAENLTHTGDILGTLRYMPAEAFEGKSDARSDVYSLGLTLYELLAMRPAFDEKDRNKLIKQVTTAEPTPLHRVNREIPRDLVTIVQKSIEKEPARRYATAEELAADLQRYMDDEPILARRQTEVERYVRWARHNPGIAALGAVLTAVLVTATIASVIVAGRMTRTAAHERLARWQAEESQKRETRERERAEQAKKTAESSFAEAREAERLARAAEEAESKQRRRAEAEKTRANITLADMQTARGLLAGERGVPAEAALWFATASAQAAAAGDSRRDEYNRLRARNWMRQATVPVAVLSLGEKARQMDFHPGGDLLLLRGVRHRAVLWSWREGKVLPWTGPLTGIGAACFSPDGASLALGFRSGEVQIRSVPDGKVVTTLRHEGMIGALAFSPDGRFLAIGSNSARVWDVGRQAFLDPIWKHPRPVNALAFNRKADRLITACADQRARVFAVAGHPGRAEPLFPPLPHAPEQASPPALVDGDRTLVTVSVNSKDSPGSELTRWDMATGKPVAGPIRSKAFSLQRVVASPDGRWFATGGYYGPEVHAADAGRPALYLGHTHVVQSFVFDRDSTMLVSASWDSTARFWSLPDGRPIGEPLPHLGLVEQCALSDDTSSLATAQDDGWIRVWRRPSDDLVIARAGNWGQRPRLSFDGKLATPGLWHEGPLYYGDQGTGRLRVIVAADGSPAGAGIALPGMLVDSCVCGDNRTVAAVCSRGQTGHLGVWEVASARPRFEPIALPGRPISVAARPDGDQLAVLCTTGDVLVLDGRTGQRLVQSRHEGWGWKDERTPRVRYTPDGRTLISLGAGTDVTVDVRDADTHQLRFAPLHPVLGSGPCRSFAVSVDSRLLATVVNGKNAAQVWDLATGRALSQPLLHPGDFYGLYSVCFSPDGRYLLTGHHDGLARYWDWQAGKLACPAMAHSDEVFDVAITPDGQFAVTAVRGAPRRIHLWELATGKPLAPPVRLADAESHSTEMLAITPDGLRALVGTSRSELSLVDLNSLCSSPTRPTAEWALMAELTIAQRIAVGDLNGLTNEQWQERWNLLHERNPQLARSRVIEAKSLRIEQVAPSAD